MFPDCPSFHLPQNTHDNTMDSLTHSSSIVDLRLVWKINVTLKHSNHVYELVGKVSEFWKNFLVPFNPSFLPNRRHLVHNLSSHKQSQKQLPSFSKILGGHRRQEKYQHSYFITTNKQTLEINAKNIIWRSVPSPPDILVRLGGSGRVGRRGM